MTTPHDDTVALWRQCVHPDFGPAEPVEGFEVLAACEEPGSNAARPTVLYRTVRVVWRGGEWHDQPDRTLALCQAHSIDEPAEELDDAWAQFCHSVHQLNVERAALNAPLLTTFAPQPRSRLSPLAERSTSPLAERSTSARLARRSAPRVGRASRVGIAALA